MQRKKPMDDQSTSMLCNRSRPTANDGMRGLVDFLAAADELLEEKEELRKLGLTEEEIAGYEEFFAENFYIRPLWSIDHGSDV